VRDIKQSRQKDQPFYPAAEIYSREAEQSVLGGLMLGDAGFKAWAQVKKILVADDFFLKEHQILWTTIESVIISGARPDIVTLGDQLQKDNTLAVIGGGAYLGHLAKNIPSAANILAYARIIKDTSLDRQIIPIGTAIAAGDLSNVDKLLALRNAKILLHSHQETLIDATNLLEMDIPKKETVLSPWLFTRDIWMIHAWRGVGKSQMAMEIAFSIATGTAMFDGRWYAPKARPVAYFDGEMGAEEVQARIKRMVVTHGVKPQKGYLKIFTPDLFKTRINIATPEGQTFANQFINDAGAEIAVMDNLSTLAGGIDENSAKEFQPVQDWLVECRAEGITAGFVNHSNKTGAQRGTSKHEDVLNASINLRKPDDDKSLMFKGARFEIHFEKTRGKTQQPFLVSLPEESVPEAGMTEGVWIVEDIEKSLPKPTPTEELFLDAISDGYVRLPDIAFELGKSSNATKMLAKKLKKKGLIISNNGVYSLKNIMNTSDT
jgi:biotin operon repressor